MPEFARTTSSRQSLTTLMHHLEQTRARIRQEQIDRTLRRQHKLRLQHKREEKLVREKTEPLLRRTESLSRSLFESQREAFILRERIETLSKSLFSAVCLSCVSGCPSIRRLVGETWLQQANGHPRQRMEGHLEESPETQRRMHYGDSSKTTQISGRSSS
jgi:hypothetical protein